MKELITELAERTAQTRTMREEVRAVNARLDRLLSPAPTSALGVAAERGHHTVAAWRG